ncbi:MAG: biotin attachment protein [Deltaproteobacteria bacterium]|nr:biotin attachment protein [Deltaproteobacteria bacterium]|tara:strand:+ start:1374 stop:3197 length:1824 start_codon:yes stop_codon:yes gene_type:complete
MAKKKIEFMETSFRDGFQSVFGARVATKDFLPALEAAVEAGIQHFEAGGGARFQSLFFYCNESAFDMMDAFRKKVGTHADLQTLSRGINVVGLRQQPRDMIDLHAKMFKKHGITTIRNFDALNDLRNLKYSAERITAHGLHHQIVITMMDLPPGCEGAHDTKYYLDTLRNILDSDVPFNSICFKDASGTANPRKVHETIKGARKMVPEGTILHLHTHDTAGASVNQYMGAIEGGIDRIDLSMSPVSGGTSQPDILTMWHALKGTDYTLDIDPKKIIKTEKIFAECFEDYFFPPESRMVSPIIPFSPMPGGALTANTMMMRDTGTLHLFQDVIREMSEVVRLGGFGASVTPVSQFYFQQAYLNVIEGKWKKINPQYGNMILGYFGKTPVEPDPEIVKLASEQLDKLPYKDDPLDLLEPGIPAAKKILQKNNLPESEENIFIVASCEEKGLDFLLGKGKDLIRKKSQEVKKDSTPAVVNTTAPVMPPTAAATPASITRDYSITVEGRTYNVQVSSGETISPAKVEENIPVNPPSTRKSFTIEISAPTPGNIVRVEVAVGEKISKDQVLLVMEAMKMESEVKSSQSGEIKKINVQPGDTVQAGDVLLTLD